MTARVVQFQFHRNDSFVVKSEEEVQEVFQQRNFICLRQSGIEIEINFAEMISTVLMQTLADDVGFSG